MSSGEGDAIRDFPPLTIGEGWSAKRHRADAKIAQAAMQRVAERKASGPVYVSPEDASDLLMAFHLDGLYLPDMNDCHCERPWIDHDTHYPKGSRR